MTTRQPPRRQPDLASTEPAGHDLECDFCYDTPSTRIIADRRPHPGTHWLTCQACEALIGLGKWDLLALRKLRAWELHEDTIGQPGDQVAMHQFCAQVRHNMTGLEPIPHTT